MKNFIKENWFRLILYCVCWGLIGYYVGAIRETREIRQIVKDKFVEKSILDGCENELNDINNQLFRCEQRITALEYQLQRCNEMLLR